jgi:hypothetical protein
VLLAPTSPFPTNRPGRLVRFGRIVGHGEEGGCRVSEMRDLEAFNLLPP